VAEANWNGPTGTEVGGGGSSDGEMQDEGGSSDDEDGRKGHNLAGSCFQDPGDGTCDVAVCKGMTMAREYCFISCLMTRRLMALSRRCVLWFWHMGPARATNKRQRRNN
jgi:hypothetical protein